MLLYIINQQEVNVTALNRVSIANHSIPVTACPDVSYNKAICQCFVFFFLLKKTHCVFYQLIVMLNGIAVSGTKSVNQRFNSILMDKTWES